MNLEGTWPVYRDGAAVGQCQFRRKGLYWVLSCTCGPARGQILRLVLLGGREPHSLGIPVPENGTLHLDRTLAVKSLPEPETLRLELWDLHQPPRPEPEPLPSSSGRSSA